MRIIGGRNRGRALAALGKGDSAAHLRPTSDRVRESLFNVLENAYGGAVSGARVLDLFAGTGALGLEALSRGAAHATFVETGRKSLALLSQNIRLCHAEAQTEVLRCDATRLPACPAPCDLVFLDPPYGKGLGETALAAAMRGGWIPEGALVIWEESREMIPPAGLHLLDARRYGDTVISFCENSAYS